MNNEFIKVIIGPDVDIRTAWRVLDSAGLRVVLIADEERNFIGIATDGDIRRGLLSTVSLDDPISAVVNTSPLTVNRSVNKKDLITLMEQKCILALPVVESGKLLGIESLPALLAVPKLNNPVFIMAGGFGTRLRPLTDSIPKPMLPIAGTPMLEVLVKRFRDLGFWNFYISTHYLPEVIQEHFGDGQGFGVSVSYVHEDSPLGTGGALGLLPASLPQLPLIVINGDVLTDIDFRTLLDAHEQKGAEATMCVKSYEVNIPYGVIEGEGDRIACMVEKPTYSYAVNTGIYVLSPAVFKGVPRQERIDMPTLLAQHIEKGDKVIKQVMHGYWLDIGRMNDYNRAQSDIVGLNL
ncbi:nucleotidyltransferase family protein [Marinagarivorans algicola]|uniref:nucleotidyltransferase family protein n=1 Tax=Marinagarivorans algicola TaxID=1513270 RepID=UPI0006B88BE1|nr:nucleotidyltransferase family protein [Marinagarivorans algicola]